MPEVAFGSENYMVVWSDERSGNYNIYAARVTPAGTVLDPAGILIGPTAPNYQFEPSIAFAGAQYFAVWMHFSAPCAVVGRFINCDGSLGDTVRIADLASSPYQTSVAFDGTNFLVVWTEDPELLKGQMVSGDGNLIGSPFTIASGVTTLISGALCFDGSCYMVTYTVRNGDYFEIWGRQYDTSGNPLSSAFMISHPAQSSSNGRVAAGDDSYLNIWTHSDYPSDIYGNVDVATGIRTGEEAVLHDAGVCPATIVRGPILLPAGMECVVFDITGREVDAATPAPGIYFITVEGRVVQKVIRLR